MMPNLPSLTSLVIFSPEPAKSTSSKGDGILILSLGKRVSPKLNYQRWDSKERSGR